MLKKNLIANYIGQVWTAFIGLAFVPLYIKFLGVEAYGLIGIFTLIQTGLAILDLGMTPTLAREMAFFTGGSKSPKAIKNLFKTIELITISISIIIFFLMYSTSQWLASSWIESNNYTDKQIENIFNLMAIVAAIRFSESIYRSTIIGLQRQVLFNVENIILSTIRAVGSLAVISLISPKIELFFIWQAFISSIGLIVFKVTTNNIMSFSNYKGKFSILELKNIKDYALGILGINILTFLITQMDKLILPKFISLEEVGFYSLASSLSVSLFLISGPITQAWFPKLNELKSANDIKLLKIQFHRASQMILIIAGSAAAVIIFFPELILELWTRDIILSKNVAPLLSILMIGSLLNLIVIIPYQLQLTYGWTKLSLFSNLIIFFIILPLYIIIIPKYNVVGAAFIWVFINASLVIISFHFMFKKIFIEEKWNWFFFDVMIPITFLIISTLILKYLFPIPETFIFKIIYLIIISIFAVSISVLTCNVVRKDVKNFIIKRMN